MANGIGNSDSDFPLDEWMKQVKEFKLLPELVIKKLTKLVISYLFEEPNVLSISSPVTICGDTHGQFYDLLTLFDVAGQMESTPTNYIFLGNYVDRGIHGVETFTYLMLLKARYPSRIMLLRGNHESRQITQVYGFYDEVMRKYNHNYVWQLCCEVFDYLPIAAIIEQKILCIHAGLSPEITTIDGIRTIQRNQEVPCEGPLCDLLWSDPETIIGWGLSHGPGYQFGADIVHEFNRANNLDLICRSHQLAMEGYTYPYGEDDPCLVHIWSAPNYAYRCGNVAAVMNLDKNLNRTFKIFKSSIMYTLEVGKSSKEEGQPK